MRSLCDLAAGDPNQIGVRLANMEHFLDLWPTARRCHIRTIGLVLAAAVLKAGGGVRPVLLKLWPGIVAVATITLYSGLSLHLTGTLAPWAKHGADPGTLALPDRIARTPPTPALAALRKNLSDLASRTNVAPAYAEDLAAATAFYDAHGGPLLWVTESGISKRGDAVIAEIRKADDWGLRALDFALPQPPAGGMSAEAAAEAEIELASAVLRYARYARGGRFSDPSRISNLLDYTPPVRPPKDVLTEISVSAAPVHLIGIDWTALVVDFELVQLEHGPARSRAGEEPQQIASRAVAQERPQLLPFDPVGDAPARMKYDHLHVCREGGRGPIGLACDDPIGIDYLAVVDHSREKLRHVVPNMELAEVRG